MTVKQCAGVYVGPVVELKGERALLKWPAWEPNLALVQFDNLELLHDGVRLAFGWRTFPRCFFLLDDEDDHS